MLEIKCLRNVCDLKSWNMAAKPTSIHPYISGMTASVTAYVRGPDLATPWGGGKGTSAGVS